jgi:hypothetical protein
VPQTSNNISAEVTGFPAMIAGVRTVLCGGSAAMAGGGGAASTAAARA